MRNKTSSWYECSVSYEKTMDDGNKKRVTEKYVVEALSFSEAEVVITNELVCLSEGLEVNGIVPAPYKEVFFSDCHADTGWFKVKVKYVFLDEKNGREKFTNAVFLVQGKDITSAKSYIENELYGTMQDLAISGINETKIVDVFTS